MTAFVWQDGERLIRFGGDALDHVWPGAELLTTERAEAGIPAGVRDGAVRIHHVPPGRVADAAAAIVDSVGGGRLVAWGGGRVIDTAKAIASARGGQVCAVPTTLSGAEMSSGHRTIAGMESRPRVRPALVLADPVLMTSAPCDWLQLSAMNALGHAAEALVTVRANPVASMAALRAAGLLAEGLNHPHGDVQLSLGSLLAGYALGSAGLALHHVVCQTIVAECGTAHADTNAVVLPHTVVTLAELAPEPMAELAAALGAQPDDLGARVSELAGGGSLSGLGVERSHLPRIADAASARSELGNISPRPDRAQVLRLLEAAW